MSRTSLDVLGALLISPRFSEIPQSENTTSARVIQHPELPDTPAYKVQVLQPSPAPLNSNSTSAYTTPAASHAPTPRSEPMLVDRILTVSEVATIFIKSLVQSAEDFLGKKITGAVISVPSTFTDAQKVALEKAAEDAGVTVLQLLDEAGAAAATTTTTIWSGDSLHPDRTQLLVDLGASGLSLSLLSVREGLTYVLADSHSDTVSATAIDDKLIKFFAADFTKKTRIALPVCPATAPIDQRAEAKFRLAIEHTKRTISASPGAATCSVESLKEGMDYTGSINRMRFDMLASPVYAAAAKEIVSLLSQAGVDAHDVDEVVYLGGTGCLPGFDNRLCIEVGLRDGVETPFARGTVVGGGVGDPTTILARGCATQAALIHSIVEEDVRAAFSRGHEAREVRATTKTLGLIFPNNLPENKEVGGTWIPVVQKETALPARRVVSFDVEVTEASKRIACEVREVKEGIRVEKVVEEVSPSDEDEDGEEPEEIEVKHRTLTKETLFGVIDTQAKLAIQAKGKSKDAGKWFTRVEVEFVVSIDGALDVELREVGGDGAVQKLHVPPL